VIIQWGNSPNHAMTIVGYNDSIRWDYNNDGQYTNHIDINLDGVVDLKDWEIGGFKMANTYGSISGWGDEGFSYMTYKSVADGFQQGGIWDNLVAIVNVKENHGHVNRFAGYRT
jgi:C1A family cysteine protease